MRPTNCFRSSSIRTCTSASTRRRPATSGPDAGHEVPPSWNSSKTTAAAREWKSRCAGYTVAWKTRTEDRVLTDPQRQVIPGSGHTPDAYDIEGRDRAQTRPVIPLGQKSYDGQPRMGFFTDTTVCIGCKACEVACKEWNDVPATLMSSPATPMTTPATSGPTPGAT